MTTYDTVVKAAERLLTDETKDTWGLADAVLAHVPGQPSGKRNDLPPAQGEGAVDVPAALSELAKHMKEDGVTTPTGDTYTSSSLKHLRDAAMAWPKDTRFPEAAYRTHLEAGSPNAEGGRVLRALAIVANGEEVARPRGVKLNAWRDAVTRVEARKKGFKVAANDVRIALERKPNVPGRKITPQDIENAITKGDVLPEEVLDVIPDSVTREEYRENRRRIIRQNVANGEEGMTDEELIKSDEELVGLFGAAEHLGATIKAAEEDAFGGPALQAAKAADANLGNSLILGRKHGIPSGDVDELLAVLADIRQRADLVAMMATGSGLSAQDEKFLNNLGIS